MELSSYFDQNEGLGVLATSDRQGKVDLAIYAKPRFYDEKNVLFVMADRLSHKNLQSNPFAAYLFKTADAGYEGKRLFLKKVREVPHKAKDISACLVRKRDDCERSFVDKELFLRETGFTRRTLEAVSSSLNKLDGKLTVVEKLPKICGDISREIVREMKNGNGGPS